MAYLINQLLAQSARDHGDAVAVADAEESISYRDLDRLSAQVAGVLLDLGVRPGEKVAIRAHKSAKTVACLYGIMRAGAAYVPVDPVAPPQRAAQVVEDCAPAAIITTATDWPKVQDLLNVHPAVLAMSGVPDQGAAWADVERRRPEPDHEGTESDLAYILYTSGSTGRPKGVMITHRNALTFIDWCVTKFEPHTGDRFSSHAPFHFDLSIHDLYVAASVGASVQLMPAEQAYFPAAVHDFIGSHQITIWYSVPTALIGLTRHLAGRREADPYPHLRLVHFAGEAYPIKELRELRRLLPAARLFNLYGPTETNVCTYYEATGAELSDMDSLPIGRACENMGVFAVTDDGRLAQPGDEGELWVRGPGVAAGYLNLPDETASRVVPNPFESRFLDRSYRTGDIVRLMPGGDYLLRGRRDHQVKLRGFRVELGDVEATITAHPHVSEAAVLVSGDGPTATLHAFCVVDEASPTEAELATWCTGRLPRYMVPERFHLEIDIPRTSTGKIDRPALRKSMGATST